jgi:membrane-associated protease RseP (regulator of RpoE activity)
MAENTDRRNQPPFFRELPAEEAQLLANTVRTLVADDLAIESIQTMRDQRQGSVLVHGRLRKPSHEVFTRWLRELNAKGYTPMLRRRDGGSDKNDVSLQVLAGVVPKERSNPWINLVLFVVTVLSTLWVGSLSQMPTAAQGDLSATFLPQNLVRGWPFALTLLGILTAHEFGHYFAARYHKVAVTLPFFIPMPLGFGTLGAFIRLKEPVPDQRKLFDIGVAGPLAGVVLAIPLLFIGLRSTPTDTLPVGQPYMLEGNSILYYTAKLYTFGRPLPDPVTGEDVMMDQGPVAWGAWIGLLVTALNLLPVGQLDGGHTVFALFGKKARYINQAALGAMAFFAVAGLGAVQQFVPFLETVGYSGWFVWLALIFFVIGPYHPPALDDVTELDPRRRLVGYLVILIFILTFVPVPFRQFF